MMHMCVYTFIYIFIYISNLQIDVDIDCRNMVKSPQHNRIPTKIPCGSTMIIILVPVKLYYQILQMYIKLYG